MVPVSILKIIFIVLLAVALFRLVRVLIHKEKESVVWAVIVCAALGAVVYGLTTIKAEKISLSVSQLKKIIFPSRTEDWEYIEEKGQFQGRAQTRYIFPEPGPRLSLVLDADSGTLSLVDLDPLNAVLDYLGLPRVEEGVDELSKITGSSLDIYTYQWDDYPLGVLIVERGLCRKLDNLDTYHCIANITVRGRV